MPDAESFDVFYRSTRQRVFAGLVGLTADPAEAQDVVHEAYARAWQRWASVSDYDGTRGPGTHGRPPHRGEPLAPGPHRLTAHRRHGLPEPVPGPSRASWPSPRRWPGFRSSSAPSSSCTTCATCR